MHGKTKNLRFIYHITIKYNMSSNDIIEIRKMQALTGERSFTLVFPKQFATELGVGRGDFMKCRVESGRLIVEKMMP
jgi:hypothetical protein